MTWYPLLEGALQQRALDLVAQIVEELPNPGGDWALADGSAASAVLCAHLGPPYEGAAEEFLRHAVGCIGSQRTNPSLYGGFTGVAWAVQHVRGLLGAGGPDQNQQIDAALARYLTRSPWDTDYDLISGLVGFGVYALERENNELLTLVVARLAETAEHTPDGITWLSRNTWVDESVRSHHPETSYNLGVAHGVPGVIAFLGRAVSAGIDVGPLLDGSVRWLLKQKLTGMSASFAKWLETGRVHEPARSAWCYGDPGIAGALLVAARAAGSADWEAEAVALAVGVARRPFEQTGVLDAGPCHGAAGNAHVLNRVYQATGDAELGEAARAWYERAITMRSADGPLEDRGMLGEVGLALTLLAATSSVEPRWDRALALS